ncbi:MAG: hypothetical protein RQ736_00055 [Thiogranum sp.]|nr:hypothetical protein [Thiogranum sp.]
MLKQSRYLVLSTALLAASANAGSTLDAAIGGGVGGATGAAIGNEVGGRDGAILGGALGAAVGTAVTTDKDRHNAPSPTPVYRYEERRAPERHPGPPFCPPGQAKKGRC